MSSGGTEHLVLRNQRSKPRHDKPGHPADQQDPAQAVLRDRQRFEPYLSLPGVPVLGALNHVSDLSQQQAVQYDEVVDADKRHLRVTRPE